MNGNTSSRNTRNMSSSSSNSAKMAFAFAPDNQHRLTLWTQRRKNFFLCVAGLCDASSVGVSKQASTKRMNRAIAIPAPSRSAKVASPTLPNLMIKTYTSSTPYGSTIHLRRTTPGQSTGGSVPSQNGHYHGQVVEDQSCIHLTDEQPGSSGGTIAGE